MQTFYPTAKPPTAGANHLPHHHLVHSKPPSAIITATPPSKHDHLKYLLCGAVAGAVSRTCTAPLDRLKVLLQTQLAPTQGSTPISLNASIANLNAACTAIYTCGGGVRSFWRGNGMNCIKIIPESGIKFYVFERAKRRLSHDEKLGIGGRFVAGGLGGLVSQFLIYPIETLKTRVMAATAAATACSTNPAPQVRSHHSVPKRRTLFEKPVFSRSMHHASCPNLERTSSLVVRTVHEIWHDGRWRGFFRGLGPSLIGIVPYAGIDLAIYETLKSSYSSRHPLHSENHPPPCIWLLMFGTVSGSIGATVVYPLSLIRTRMQAQGTLGHPHRYTSTFQCIKRTYQRETVRGFYKGLAPTLIKVIPAASISYLCYENMKVLVGL